MKPERHRKYRTLSLEILLKSRWTLHTPTRFSGYDESYTPAGAVIKTRNAGAKIKILDTNRVTGSGIMMIYPPSFAYRLVPGSMTGWAGWLNFSLLSASGQDPRAVPGSELP